jgi:hypothetical protein
VPECVALRIVFTSFISKEVATVLVLARSSGARVDDAVARPNILTRR